jgi:hypothetical protein
MTAPITIRPDNLMRILGLSYEQCRRKLVAIRQVNGKKRGQCVTISETADFLGLSEETIIKHLETPIKPK